MSQLHLSREEFVKRYQAGVAKGVVLAAADAQINGFYAGAFTYNLTQYLWQQTSTPERAIAYVVPDIFEGLNQTPRYEAKVGSGNEKKPIYFINNPSPAADAVITEVKGNEAKLWLGGAKLEELDNGTVFTIIDAKGGSSGKVTLRSHEGLVGVATVEGAIQPGVLLRKTEGLSTGI